MLFLNLTNVKQTPGETGEFRCGARAAAHSTQSSTQSSGLTLAGPPRIVAAMAAHAAPEDRGARQISRYPTTADAVDGRHACAAAARLLSFTPAAAASALLAAAEPRLVPWSASAGNWPADDTAHDIALPGSTGPAVGFLIFPQAETAAGRLGCLDPDGFEYALTATEVVG
jgi:hypothetical protein